MPSDFLSDERVPGLSADETGPQSRPLRERPEAEAFVAGLLATMNDLDAVLARESEGVRAGRLREALEGSQGKAALTATYLNGLEAAKANAVALARLDPEGLARLRRAHGRFAASVETNQTVLATARSVCEGLVRQLAEEAARARTPTIYGLPSQPPSPYGRTAGQALVLSRHL